MQSTVTIDLDENDKIVKLEDKWNGDDQPTKLGAWVSEYPCERDGIQCTDHDCTQGLRNLNAATMPHLVKVPEPPKEIH